MYGQARQPAESDYGYRPLKKLLKDHRHNIAWEWGTIGSLQEYAKKLLIYSTLTFDPRGLDY